MPGSGSRYDIFQGTPLTLVRDRDDFEYGSSDKRLRPQWAARYQTLLFESFDAALYYFHGYRRFPLFLPVLPAAATAGSVIEGAPILTHYYAPLHQGGLTFQGALGNWLLKGETAMIRYEQDIRARDGGTVDPWFAYTTGFEYTFYAPWKENQDLGAIMEFIGDTDAGKDESRLDGFRPFRSHVFTGFRYAFNNAGDRSLLGGVFLDYLEGDVLYRLEYAERFLGRVSIKAEISGVDANGTSQFRPFERAARMSTEAKYHF
jgi:hypothetical protein